MDRGRRLYDRWADRWSLFRLLSRVAFAGREAELRRRSVASLGLSTGERVLDLGAGPGVNAERLGRPVGPTGGVVCLDYSERMTARARDRVRDAPAPTGVVRGDAARLPFPDESFDAAYASLSLTAMPDAAGAVREVRRVLRPGGRFAVLDARPYDGWPHRLLNPVNDRVNAWATNWHPDTDVVGLLREVFPRVDARRHNHGSFVTAVARRAPE
ncbi:class I SAM-dependent methyltransferase [Halosegnis marinus]|uniref:Class I SAM-dependent methyltransferase n=1 Tax=Halosegnis marinus TaxID=3034023 RepID=A0ABD5ZJR0_9EURY|nr:methyltransferase domain-containing protein [Halosegnis sp. DT85]